MTLSASELYRRGRAHLNAGRNAAARRALGQAAERTDDVDLLARIAGSLAAVIIRQGDPVTAEALCRDALASPALSAQTAAMLHGQLGLLALERGDLDEAVEWLDRGIEGIGDEVEHRAPMLLNRSLAHMQAGRVALGRADLDRAAPDYAATGNEVERAMAVHNAGYAALLEGDLIRALERMGEAYRALAGASPVNAAICDLDRAEVLRDAGLATEAERRLERVARVFGSNRMPQARGEAEFHLARSLLTHDPRSAATVAAMATRRFRRVRSDWWARRADAVRLRALLAMHGRGEEGAERPGYPSAAELDAAAAALVERSLTTEASVLRLSVELARARRHQDDAGRAVRSRRRPVRVAADAPIQLRLLAYEVRAARAAADGDDARARRHAADGLDELANWQASFGSLDLATSLAMHGEGLIFAGLQSAVRSRHPDVIFEWSERARQLSQQVVPLRPPPDPELAAELAELRLIRSDVGGQWMNDSRAAGLTERIRQRQWATTGVASQRSRIDLPRLQVESGDEVAFVTYVFDGASLVALATAGGTSAVVDIERWPRVFAARAGLRADLDVAASIGKGPMGDVVRRALDARLNHLSSSLIEPLQGIIGDRRTVITVPGILGGIPWGMLPAMRGRIFTVATSATQWVADRSGAVRSGIGFVRGPHVARANEEIETAGRAWTQPTVLRDEAASVEHATHLAGEVGVLHIAAHGRHSADNPLFSGLELADGTLFGYDIDLIEKVPDTVILSACEVGRSSVRWGEEAIGMTRVWLHAGTRCVIAAPVIVADDDACELLGAMHEGLAAGKAPAVALAEASARTGIIAPFQAHGAGF